MKINLSVAGTIVSLVFISGPAQAISLGQSTVKDWNNATLEAIENARYGPTRVARALSIVNTGIFDAWAAYDPVAIGTQLPKLQRPDSENTLTNKAEAISYAAYNTLANQFPTQKPIFDSLMANLNLDPNNTTSTTAQIGQKVAQAVIESRRNDGSNQFGNLSPSGIPFSDYTGYQPLNLPDTLTNTDPSTILDPDYWQPLKQPDGSVQFFLTPHWNKVTPFALTSGDQLRPTEGPIKYSEDPAGYIQQAKEVLDFSANLTDREKAIAEFWAAGLGTVSPLGLWDQFAQEVSDRNQYTLDDDVKLFFTLNNSYLDASIAAWDTKRAFDSVRPATAIHFLGSQNLFPNDGVQFRINPITGVQEVFAWARSGQGTKWIPVTEWVPYLGVTPPFPEFVSAHSTFSGAAAEILKLFTGSDAFGGSRTITTSTIEPDGFATPITLQWDTFSDALEEAGISRLYGGIHFNDGNLVGQNMGREVGRLAWNKSQSYIQGTISTPEPNPTFGYLVLGSIGIGLMIKRVREE